MSDTERIVWWLFPRADVNAIRNDLPRHISIIMDGNGRWAKERGLPRIKGHEQGSESVRAVTEECVALGVEFLTVYAFSTENWKRPPEEVQALWLLLEHFVAQELPTLMKNNVRLRTIGRVHELPESCQRALDAAIERTSKNTATTLVLALNYSARTGLVDATRAICAKGVDSAHWSSRHWSLVIFPHRC